MYCFLLDFYVRNGFVTGISFSSCLLFTGVLFVEDGSALSISHFAFHICGGMKYRSTNVVCKVKYLLSCE